MEISWEVKNSSKTLFRTISTAYFHFHHNESTMLSAADVQTVERAPPEVFGVVEKERFPRGVEERDH